MKNVIGKASFNEAVTDVRKCEHVIGGKFYFRLYAGLLAILPVVERRVIQLEYENHGVVL
jgi:hypothetical protein